MPNAKPLVGAAAQWHFGRGMDKRHSIDAASDFAGTAAFSVARPNGPCGPVVFSSPHSGRHYPARFLSQSRLDAISIRRSEDAYVDELFAGVADCGAPLVKAHFPRAYLDVNRDPLELDPRLFRDPLPAQAQTRSPRVVGGLGAIPRVVGEGIEIYAGKLPLSEAHARLDLYHRPYHGELAALLAQARRAHGIGVLVDCHSMPASVKTGPDGDKADFVIGDRFGRAAASGISDTAIALLRGLGYRVAHNKPYAGGYITDYHGRPARGLHALQIEISRGLYLDEARIVPNAGFARLKADLTRFATDFVAYCLRAHPAGLEAAE